MLNSISINQALDLWSELEQAYYDNNGFGGNVAEIYAYRLMPYSPLYVKGSQQGVIWSDEAERVEGNVMDSLYELLKMFKDKRGCKIYVDGKLFGKWIKSQRNLHRWHITVIA